MIWCCLSLSFLCMPLVSLGTALIGFGAAVRRAKKRPAQTLLTGAYLVCVTAAVFVLYASVFTDVDLQWSVFQALSDPAVIVATAGAPVGTGVWFARTLLRLRRADPADTCLGQRKKEARLAGAITLTLTLLAGAVLLWLRTEPPL